jgi:glucosamine--fructose-6-phosphate aminotransferase (isomerizing)
MCGIFAYKGGQWCLPFLLNGLKKLEYRGYDSAGVALLENERIVLYKQAGSVEDLIEELKGIKKGYSSMGMGHTRWATHGNPSGRNAHPHATHDNKLCIVHNGIIENYSVLKTELKEKGYMFASQTDTEVLLNLIHDYWINDKDLDLLRATKLALERVVGAYAIVLMEQASDRLIIARKGSPLVVGVGKTDGEFFLSSDTTALSCCADKVIYLEDEIIGEIGQNITIYNMVHGGLSSCNVEKLEHQLYDIDKGNFDSFMLKEIYEQPKIIKDCIAGRIDGYRIKLGGLMGHEKIFETLDHITIVACGSSWHSGLLAKYYIEELCHIKVSVEYASEFCYRKPYIKSGDVIIGISQSGETADTINALKLAKDCGAFIIGICNVVNSSISRLTDCGIYLRAGAEIGVASTKAFTNQILVLLLLSLWIEQIRGTCDYEYRKAIVDGIRGLSGTITNTLNLNDKVEMLSRKFSKAKNCLYLGRGYNFPIALEGALKLKEISYIHAEGYPAAEMKHGPIALIDKNMPVLVIANNKNQLDKIESNIKEIQARKGKIITIYSQEEWIGDYGIRVPSTIDILSVFSSVVLLQLFSYHIAKLRGCNVDKPRNLAKSVTVE